MGDDDAPHIPVLLEPILAAIRPVRGLWLDATLGAGGYTRALLDAGAERVIGIDRDPLAHDLARDWAKSRGDRLTLVQDTFSNLDQHADQPLDGVVIDLGVSSMQLDRPERGFSFMKDGPLDMRMSDHGPTAADLVNGLAEGELADLLYAYGEERASRRIARAIVSERAKAPITTTKDLAQIIEGQLPRPKPGQSHPATRSFQALRIAVNDEFLELAMALGAAERALKPGGVLAVVSFHSLEDRIVKQFLTDRARSVAGNRHAPMVDDRPQTFELMGKSIEASADEIARNPRARSARLRLARRTDAAPRDALPKVPELPKAKRR